MAKRGPKAHPLRNLWIYLRVKELCKGTHKNDDRLSKSRAISEVRNYLADTGITNLSIPAVWSAYYDGQELYDNPTSVHDHVVGLSKASPRRKNPMGRPFSQDAVRDCIIYDAVCAELKKGTSLRRAFRIVRDDPDTWLGPHTLSISSIRLSFEKIRSYYSR